MLHPPPLARWRCGANLSNLACDVTTPETRSVYPTPIRIYYLLLGLVGILQNPTLIDIIKPFRRKYDPFGDSRNARDFPRHSDKSTLCFPPTFSLTPCNNFCFSSNLLQHVIWVYVFIFVLLLSLL